MTPNRESVSFYDLEWNLPLFDDLFLSMQVQNIMFVDLYLHDLERALLREYAELERTPIESTMFLSALSQMWIFAVYELLRTWRDRVKQLKKAVQKPSTQKSSKKELAGFYLESQLEELRNDPKLIQELDEAYTRVEPIFRRIEALRMNLAKHEVPKKDGVPALAPGYARIDILTGSIQWQVDLGDNAVALETRRGLAEYLFSVVTGGSTARQRRQERAAKPSA